jgi:hypothetical protein
VKTSNPTNIFLFVFQLNYNEVFDWNDDSFKITLETNNEVEKGSNKLSLTLPNRELKTYTSNWYFNYDDFKTKGNKIFILRDCNLITLYYPSAVNTVTDK